MDKPLLYDVFCGAGGCSAGYVKAGFRVVGIDNRPQPRYLASGAEHFIQMDAFDFFADYLRGKFTRVAAFSCSPPCQAYSALKHLAHAGHPELVDETREALQRTGKPYVIENVVGAPLRWPLMLCGSMFWLETPCGAQLRRHRLFESNLLLMSPGHCRHGERPLAVNGHEFRNEATRWEERRGETISVCGDRPHNPRLWRAKQRKITVTGTVPQQNVERNRIRETFSVDAARQAMGIGWMTMKELSQAIPPVYTEWIGTQLLQHMHAR